MGYRRGVSARAIPADLREGLLIGFGASFGALVRFALTPLMAPHPPAELLVVLAINIVGTFLMGLLDPGPFWGKGMLGGFTTFSAVSLAAMQSSAWFALIYMGGTLAVAVVSWMAGDALRRHRGRNRP